MRKNIQKSRFLPYLHLIKLLIFSSLALCGCSGILEGLSDGKSGYDKCGNRSGQQCNRSVKKITLSLDAGRFSTRSIDPDEMRINDLNIFAFTGDSLLEKHDYIRLSSIGADSGFLGIEMDWIGGTECIIMVCANFGYKMTDISSMRELLEYRYHLAYPDEYSKGMPMSGSSGTVTIEEEGQEVEVKLNRLMAKICLRIDRSRLESGVKFNVRSVEVGGTAKSVSVFKPSKAGGISDIFQNGFFKGPEQADILNIGGANGISGELSLYVLENLNGDLLPGNQSEKDKMLNISDETSGRCSYVEIKAEYSSESWYSKAGEYLKYRFYLGDGPANFDVERNCRYDIVVCPEGNGLSEDSWRIDKSALARYGPATLTVVPGNFIQGYVGDDIRIRAEVTPSDARVEFCKEELEFDRERGIYDFTVDEDGKGVTLHLKKGGSGIVYIEAGMPTSASEAVVVEVLKK